MKNTFKSFMKSVISLLLCFSMLLGTSWAWFSEEITSAGNKVVSGTLKVDLELLDKKTGEWNSLKESKAPIFDYDKWEPGYTDVKILKIENEGTLALKWVARFVSNDELSDLTDVIDVYVCPSVTELTYPADRDLEGYTHVGNLTKFINTISETTYGVLDKYQSAYLGIALKMQTTAGVEYEKKSIGGTFDIRIDATQWTGEEENDSFGNDYDINATLPAVIGNLTLTADITDKVDEFGKLKEEVKLYDRNSGVAATVPAQTAIADNATKLILRITEDEVIGNITLDLRVGYDVTIEGIADNNATPITVLMPKVLPAEQTGLQLYHDGNAMTRVYTVEALYEREGDNDTYGDKFLYDPATGDVTISVLHFSNVSLGSTTSVVVKGANIEGIEINLNKPGDWLKEGVITVPADGNTYILTWDSGDMSQKNALDLTLTHTWHNINPGTYSSTPIKVEKGATVVLNGVNIRTNTSVDAIELVNPASYAGEKLKNTYIYVADGTQNWLTGKSGIGFGANGTYNAAADIYVEGEGNLYTTAMGWGSPGIGVDSYSDGNLSNMHFNVGFLRSIPMNAAAGIGGGFANTSWFCLNLMEFNGGTYHVYRGGDSASIGTGTNGYCGDIVINAGSNVYCYTNPWTAYGRNMGHGMYAGTCTGIYVSKDAYVYGWNHITRSYGDWEPNTGYVPNGNRVNDAAVIVEDFDSASIKIVSSKVVAGVITEVKAKVNGELVDLDPSKCFFDGTNVIVVAVKNGDEIVYLNSPTASMAAKAAVNTVVTISSIAAAASGYKTQYYVGDEYDSEGFKLTATYSDGTTAEITEGFTVTGFDSTTVGDKTLTVTYKGKTATFTINVMSVAPNNAKITTPATKTDYFVGQELDLSGLVITVTNNNGTTYTVEKDFNASGFDKSAAGTQTITVTVDERVAVTFTVTVKAIEPADIKITTAPDKIEYFVGDTLNLAGMVITITNNNGSSYTVTSGYNADVTQLTTAGQQKVTITVDGLSVDLYVTVNAVVLDKIEVTPPTKMDYVVGDALDLSGMKVTAVYNNGDRKDITDGGYTLDSAVATTVGSQTITVTYEGKTATFNINVKAVELDKIEVTAPTKTEYYVDDELKLDGMKVTAVYNNGTREQIDNNACTVTGDTTNAGQQTITVSYNGKEATFTINVTAVIPTDISITGPTKTKYFVGDSLDFTGFKAVVTFNNGKTETFESKNGEKPEEITISDYTNLTEGDNKVITVSYTKNGETVSGEFNVTVNAKSNFLYRVGNQNNVTTAQIATMLTGAEHNGSNVTVAKHVGEVSYSNNKFTGTGIVKVTIDGIDYYLEVVNAYNLTDLNERHGNAGGKDWVLIKNLTYTYTDTITIANMSWYGNGFTVYFSDFDGAYDEQFIINASNVRFDNIKLVGPIYEKAYVYQEDAKKAGDIEYYRSLIQANDGTEILNSYISGARTPVRMHIGTVNIINSTISGGSVANIDVKGGTLNLNNVTIINQGTDVVGYGILLDNDAISVTINVDDLVSYNWLAADDVDHMNDPTNDNYMDDILTSVLESKSAAAVNFSLVCLNTSDDVKISGIQVETAKIGDNDGRLYSDATTEDKQIPEYVPNEVAPVLPEFVWSDKLDNGEFITSFEEGGSATLPDGLLIATKFGKTLDVAITSGTTEYKNLAVGTHTFIITYTVTDPYIYDKDGNQLNPEYYTVDLKVTVTVTEKGISHPDFIFTGMGNTTTQTGIKVDTANDNVKYITAVQSDTTGFKKVATQNGVEIYAPIVEVYDIISYDGSTQKYRRAVPVFGGVTIKQDKTTIADSSTDGNALPSGFTWVTGNDGENNYLDMAVGWESYQTNANWYTKGDYNGLMRVTKMVSSSTWKKNYTDAGGTRDFVIEYTYSSEDGITYHYYICYRGDSDTENGQYNEKKTSCVTGDTLVMLADGTQKRIDEVAYDDILLAWDFETGEYAAAPASFIHNHGMDNYRVLTLNFSDGTVVRVIEEHGFFDKNVNDFIYISEHNVANYVGDEFVKVYGDSYTTVTLDSYSVTEEYVGNYSLQTAFYNNFVVAGMFSMTGPDFEGWFDYFDITDDMKYDEAHKQAEIAKYGLTDYADWAEFVTYEEFLAFNGQYVNILIGRGVVTIEDVFTMMATVKGGN